MSDYVFYGLLILAGLSSVGLTLSLWALFQQEYSVDE